MRWSSNPRIENSSLVKQKVRFMVSRKLRRKNLKVYEEEKVWAIAGGESGRIIEIETELKCRGLDEKFRFKEFARDGFYVKLEEFVRDGFYMKLKSPELDLGPDQGT
nr:hypothetical protein CFP56_13683 [Quercus suber]